MLPVKKVAPVVPAVTVQIIILRVSGTVGSDRDEAVAQQPIERWNIARKLSGMQRPFCS